ncbi:TOMM precursor leader peptide-binding protein [Streptomyces chiangmaiensis]|uniref:TOMM leader peptide-binding protein n=1 Tax=Streptomyces chiangmaiensis TaxID=766497 RepID=A0ABU7FIV7_9ACTN|nr:TOMM precursor leader peptide-binding protein [Streptomyces chiangmaiensis]MED7823748.1 TOMM precursor leader peptide-binding protein [Streptomyces chiangmaiensis]
MTGEHTIGELCEGLNDKRRKTTIGLMRTLLDRGFARAVPPPDERTLPAGILDLFAPQINFVEHFMHADQRTPQELFARFRSSRVLVSGPPGGVAAAAVRGLLRNGLAEVSLDDAAWGRDFDSETARLADASAPAHVVVLPSTPQDLTAFDIVVAVADGSGSTALLDLTRRLRGVPQGPRLLPVVADPNRMVVGPISGPGEQPCWVCAQLRLSANSDPRRMADFWRGLAVGPTGTEVPSGSPMAQSMVGNALAFEIFRLRTGQLQMDDERHVVIQDLTTLESRRERVLPHPGCPLRHERVPSDDVQRPPTDDSDAYGRAAVLVSPEFGLMSGWTDESIRQIPLKTGRVRLGSPGSLTDEAREIVAFDIDTALVARTRSVQSAVACYVGRLGPVGLPDGALPDAADVVPAERLDLFNGLPAPDGWSAGPVASAVSLHDESRWQVPVAAVHPLSPANSRQMFEPSPAGAAVGWTVEDVQESGLCSALAYRGLVRAIRGGEPARPLSEEWLGGDDETSFALGSLRPIGRHARVYALPGAVPSFAVLAVVEGADGAMDWAIGSQLSVRAAVRTAVRDAVGLAVGRHHEGAPMDLGDPLMADFDPRTLAQGDAKAEWSFGRPGVPMSEALARLDADGTRVLFVDTTTIDLRAVRGMITGTILLAAK